MLTDDDIRALIVAHGSNAAPTEANGHTTGDYPLARAVIAAYEAKLAQQADRQRVPEGQVLVPMEPTPEMVRAVGMTPRVYARKVWAAMLAAAPEAPAQGETVTLQEVWEWAGGNPGIKPTRDEVREALQMLDKVCDEAPAQPHKLPIPPAGADAFEVVYSEGWNAACEAFFGGKPAPEPLVVTVHTQGEAPAQDDQTKYFLDPNVSTTLEFTDGIEEAPAQVKGQDARFAPGGVFVPNDIAWGIVGSTGHARKRAVDALHALLKAAPEAPAQDWTPTAENINALPEPVRKFVHELASNCDPAGTVRDLTIARDTIRALEARAVDEHDRKDAERYQGVRCMCVLTGCRAGPGCPHYCDHCKQHIAALPQKP